MRSVHGYHGERGEFRGKGGREREREEEESQEMRVKTMAAHDGNCTECKNDVCRGIV